MKKYLTVILIGLSIVFALDFIIGNLLEKYYFTVTSGNLYRATHSLDEVEADILIFGTSRANHHYDSKLIEELTGKTVYNTGRDGHFIFYQTAVLKAVLERYNPKQVILDFEGTFEFNQLDYDKLSSLLPYYKSHPEIRDIIKLKSDFEKQKLVSKIYPYNSMLTTIAVGNSEQNKNRSNNKGAYKGFVPLEGVWQSEIDSLETHKRYEHDENKIKIFEEFVRLTKEKGIDLKVFYSPIFYLYDEDYSIKVCGDICKKYNVEFIDFSRDTDFLNNRNYFKDRIHLNSKGANLYTRKVLKNILSQE
jgi:hypothetical protein